MSEGADFRRVKESLEPKHQRPVYVFISPRAPSNSAAWGEAFTV